MATYRPFTRVQDLPANANGDVTILEAHLDAAHETITDVLEYLTQAVWSSGGVVMPGTVSNPSDALVRVQGRLGVTQDAKTLLAVGDQTVDLAEIPTGTRCLVVIEAKAGAATAHNFVDATTGESLTHSLLSSWGKVEVLQGDASTYPPLPDGCVPVARVTKASSSAITLDGVITTPPTPRNGGGGGGGASYYDPQLGFTGVPDAGAADVVLIGRDDVTISASDPGEVSVGTPPADGPANFDVRVNGVSVGSFEIATTGAVTWSVSNDIELARGDLLALVAPDPADSALAGVLVAFRGTAA